MKRLTFSLSLVSLLIGFGGAAAESPANLLNAERRMLANDYAKCIATKHPKLVREFVLQAGNSKQPDDRIRKLADWKCMPSSSSREVTSLYFSSSAALYTFAEYLLKNEKIDVLNDFGAVPLLQHPEPEKMDSYKPSGRLSKEAYARMVEKSLGETAMSRIGECAVRADTINSKNLLETAVESAEEMAAIQILLPVVGQCIENGSIKMKPEQLRGTIALNLYRLTVAALTTESKPDA